MNLDEWGRWGGSKSEVARNAKRYADAIGSPSSEVLLSLLWSALCDLRECGAEADFFRSVLEDPAGTIDAELWRRGWTRKELSDRAGVSAGTVSNWLNGKRGTSIATLRAIVSAIGFEPEGGEL